jgi:hypothetical protein
MSIRDGWDIAGIVFDFLAHLPRTVRPEIVSSVLRYATEATSQGEVANLRKLGAELTQDPGPRLFASLLRIVTTLDYVLARSAATIGSVRPRLEDLIRDAAPEEARVFQRRLLQLPLRERHIAQASDEWSKLRATFLSSANLRQVEEWCASEFERRILAPATHLTGAAP